MKIKQTKKQIGSFPVRCQHPNERMHL